MIDHHWNGNVQDRLPGRASENVLIGIRGIDSNALNIDTALPLAFLLFPARERAG
jgi:hypothetical protein